MAQRHVDPASPSPAAPGGLFGLTDGEVSPADSVPEVRRSLHGNRIHAGAAVGAVSAAAVPPRQAAVETRLRRSEAAATVEPRPRSTPVLAAALVAVALMVVVYAGIRWRSEIETSAARAHPLHSSAPAAAVSRSGSKPHATVLRDSAGTILAVRGPNAESVLTAWCEAKGSIDPGSLLVARSVPDRPDVRVGMWRSADRASTGAIEVFRLSAGSYWVAGDGKHPVPVFAPARLGFQSPTPVRSPTPAVVLNNESPAR